MGTDFIEDLLIPFELLTNRKVCKDHRCAMNLYGLSDDVLRFNKMDIALKVGSIVVRFEESRDKTVKLLELAKRSKELGH